MRYIQYILIFSISAVSIHAERSAGFRQESYEFRQVISVPQNTKAVYGVLDISKEFQQKSSLIDIRIEADGIEVPYFLRSVRTTRNSYNVPVTIELNQADRDGRTIVLSVPAPGDGYELTDIVLGDAGLYEASVYVSTGTADNLIPRGNQPVYSYRSAQELSIRIDPPSSKNNYVKLRFSGVKNIPVSHAVFTRRASATGSYEKIAPENLDISYNSDTDASVIDYLNEENNRVSRIRLSFQEKVYSRRFTVDVYDDYNKSYEQLSSGTLRKNRDDKPQQLINLGSGVTGKIRLQIYNEDNQALSPDSFEIFTEAQQVVMELPQSEKAFVYFGNEYVFSPEYDITDVYDKDLQHIQLTPGNIEKNPDFAYSVTEPPMSVWIMRILFIAGLLVFAIPAVRIFKKYNEVMH